MNFKSRLRNRKAKESRNHHMFWFKLKDYYGDMIMRPILKVRSSAILEMADNRLGNQALRYAYRHGMGG